MAVAEMIQGFQSNPQIKTCKTTLGGRVAGFEEESEVPSVSRGQQNCVVPLHTAVIS